MGKFSSLTDTELLQLLKNDDQEAMREIYDRFWKTLLTACINVIDNYQEAEECVQDIFANLWTGRQRLQLQYSLRTYLSTAVKYRAITRLSRRYRLQQRIMQCSTDTELLSPSAEESILLKELWEKIAATVAQLPEKTQLVFRLSREAGMSNKQIAAQLGVTEKAVEANTTRALRDIKTKLGPSASWLLLL